MCSTALRPNQKLLSPILLSFFSCAYFLPQWSRDAVLDLPFLFLLLMELELTCLLHRSWCPFFFALFILPFFRFWLDLASRSGIVPRPLSLFFFLSPQPDLVVFDPWFLDLFPLYS